ncbi:uncharacterized protein LOC131242767 [Magnolia sinica]|uniref:uncharacterized protein LOC131242767 n=1 Tax=Magnolia sinica TaxID=86752 RepID=UPI0026593FEB|nr:uncharacterized protein LOC131242767 [Magnolia sinica]
MEAAGYFNDWEMLQNPDANLVTAPDSSESWSDFDRAKTDSGGVIRSDYFAIDSEKVVEGDGEVGFIESGDRSSVDSCLNHGQGDDAEKQVGFDGIEIPRGNLGGLGSNSGSDRLDAEEFGDFEGKSDLGCEDDAKKAVGSGGIELPSGKLSDFLLDSGGDGSVAQKFEGFDGGNVLGFEDDVKEEVGFEGIGETEGVEVEPKNFREFWSDMSSDDGMVFESSGFDEKIEMGYEEDAKGEVGFEGITTEHKNPNEFLMGSGGDELIAGESGGVEGEGELSDVQSPKRGDGSQSRGIKEAEGAVMSDSVEFVERDGDESPLGVDDAAAGEVKSGEGAKKVVVWWKLPLELLKFCVFRVSPVWSISIAAAVMGIIILRRRLYRMKLKSQSIPLNLNDEKKVSEVMVRVARFNEAISVVRRIPVVRSSLPAAGGVIPWPVVSLR